MEEFIDVHSDTRKYRQRVDKIKKKSATHKKMPSLIVGYSPFSPPFISATVTFTFLNRHFDMDDKKITLKIDCSHPNLDVVKTRYRTTMFFPIYFPIQSLLVQILKFS